ncbi:hypothetical protein BsWGS_12586 [Bradybaena similaris]
MCYISMCYITLCATLLYVLCLQVNCIEDYYTEDEEVLLAYKDIQPQQCPLAGGYQLIMRQGMAVGGFCMNSVKTYNPHIQFHCDGRGSGNVLVDFGKACEPTTLAPYMGERHFTHLKCVSHWLENGFHSVLLQMRDHPESFWCLHYKVVSSSSFGGKNAAHEELLKVFLTLDGRCSSQAFGTEDVPRNTTMFGHLASYRSINDIKCTEKVYVETCKLNEDKCLESVECPSYCGRCKKHMTNQSCNFPAEALGFWKVLNSIHRLEVTVEKSRIKSPNFGDFLCLRSPDTGGQDYIYSVVQVSTAPTCMPYYSCAKLLSPSPGVLTFQLRPGFRSQETGEPLACEESHQEGLPFFHPPGPEQTVTLINQNKLQRTSCKLAHRSTFPTKLNDECKIVVHECSGSCQSFNVSFDVASCRNNTQDYNIENQHICYATIQFADTVRGILAKSGTSGRYLCWIFGSSRLFVATVEDCNQDSVNRIFRERTADVLYDPVTAISLPTGTDNSARAMSVQIPSVFMYSLLLAYILGLVFTTNDCR